MNTVCLLEDAMKRQDFETVKSIVPEQRTCNFLDACYATWHADPEIREYILKHTDQDSWLYYEVGQGDVCSKTPAKDRLKVLNELAEDNEWARVLICVINNDVDGLRALMPFQVREAMFTSANMFKNFQVIEYLQSHYDGNIREDIMRNIVRNCDDINLIKRALRWRHKGHFSYLVNVAYKANKRDIVHYIVDDLGYRGKGLLNAALRNRDSELVAKVAHHPDCRGRNFLKDALEGGLNMTKQVIEHYKVPFTRDQLNRAITAEMYNTDPEAQKYLESIALQNATPSSQDESIH